MTIETQNEYQWNDGFSTLMDVKVVVKELHAIQEEKGEINPELIVEHAKDKKSALHNYFVWDNKTAANKYRLQQASELLRRIEVRVVKDGEPKTLRAFEVVNKTAHASNYLSFDLADGFSRAKQVVVSDLNRCLSRLDPYAEFGTVSAYIKNAIQELLKVSTETQKEQPAIAS